ncbi:ESPR-type extended signal peptide-containing protein, partial [Rodentibacter caecimuris]|uniref:ESPR-type extended signal peptide-containing protein n=1 Tax=Rodentibacter caecimuris TaxID=1796644 RepID=UPI00296F69EE
MNKIFKVIWNQSLGAWVAVSELAKGYCKSASFSQDERDTAESEKETKTFFLSKISLAFLVLGVSVSSYAARNTTAWDSIGIGERDPTARGVDMGTGAEDSPSTNRNRASSVSHSIGIGGGVKVKNARNAIAIGYEAKVENSRGAKDGSIALGAYSIASGANTGNEHKQITIGGNNYSFAGISDSNSAILSVGGGNQYKTRQIQNVGSGRIAADSTDAINGSQLYAVVEALGNVSGGNGGLSNFTLGAGKQNSNITVNKDADKNHFDIISGNETYLTTEVDGRNIKVDLTNKTKDAIEQVEKNKTNITNNAQNITQNTQNISNNTKNIEKGFGLKAQDSQTVNKKLGEYVEVIGGNSNINTTVADGKIKINLNNSLDLGNAGNVKLGDVNLNNTGLTINNGPSVTSAGINAGNKKITNVSNGTVDANSKDAVNGSQLYATNQNVTNLNNEVAKGWNITTSKSGTGNVSNTSTSKVAMGETVTIDAGDNINITQAGKKVTIATSSTPNFTSVSTGGLTVRPSGKVDFGGNVLTNIGAPTNNTDATTKKYVDDGRTKVTSNDGTVKITESNGPNRTYDLSVNVSNVAQNIKYKGDTGNGTNKLSEELNFKGSDLITTKAENGTVSFDLGNNATFGLTTQNGNVSKKVGNTIQIEGNNSNINTLVESDKVKINLNNNLNLTDAGSVTIGDSTLNSTGLTIKGGPKVVKDGIDAGNKKITNVSEGNISNTSKDAINGSQLYATNQNVTNISNEVAKGWNITTSKSGTGNVTNTTTAKVAMGDMVTIDAGDNINITQAGKKVTIATSLTPNFTSVDTGSLTVRSGGKVDFGGNNITNVGAPVSDNDATTKKYVDEGRTTVNSTDGSVTVNGTGTNPKNYDLSVNMTKVANDVKLKYKGDNNTEGENKLSDAVTFKGSTDIVTNVSNGQVAFDLADTTKNKINNAIQNFTVGADQNNTAAGLNITNGGRFDIIGTNYTTTAVSGNNITVGLDANATDAIDKARKGFGLKADDGNNVTHQLGNAIEVVGGNSNINTTINDGKLKVNLNNTLNLTKDGSVTIGNTTVNDKGLTINGGPNITIDGIDAGNKKITNVADGNISNGSKEAINGGQLYTAIANSGFNLATNGDATNAQDKRINSNETFNLNQSTNILVKQIDNGYEIATAENVSFTNVTVGKDGKDGVIGINGQNGTGVVINGKDGSIGLTGPKGTDGKNASANISVANGSGTLDNATNGGDGITRLVYNTTNKDGSTTTREIATKDDGLKFKGDHGEEIAKKLGSTLNITGGANKDALTDNNIGVITKGGNLTVKLAKDLNLTENGSVTIGNLTINKDGFNAGNTTITNVKGNLDNVTNTTTSNPNTTNYEDKKNNAATVGDVLNAGWNLQNNGQAVDFVTHGNTVNFNNGTGVSVKADYNSTTGTTNVTFNTTNSYVDKNGNLTNEPTNKVKFVGGNASAPVLITNVDSGVLPNGTAIPSGQTFNDVLNNVTGNDLNNVVNVGDLQNATKNISNATLGGVGFNLKSANVSGTNGVVSQANDLNDAGKRLTNNETFNLNAGNNIVIKQINDGYEVATAENVTFTNITVGKDGKDGVDGTIGVKGKDGSAVVLNGKDGSIGLKGKDGASANITVTNGTGTLDPDNKGGKGIERLVYNTTN